MRHNCGGFGNIRELSVHNCGSLATVMHVADMIMASSPQLWSESS